MRSVSLVFAAACLVCCAPDAPEAEPPAAAPVAATLSDEDVRGGSALLWATLLAPINPEAEIITIDIKDKRPPEAREHPHGFLKRVR